MAARQRIHYGAADTTIALATARLDDLTDLCEPLEELKER